MTRTAITVVTGLPGSGKTTLIERAIAAGEPGRAAAVVHELGDASFDATRLAEAGTATRWAGDSAGATGVARQVASVIAASTPAEVFIEVNGLTAPGEIIAELTKADFGPVRVIAVVDAERALDDRLIVDGPGLTLGNMLDGQVAASGCTVVSKTERASVADVDDLAAIANKRGAGTVVIDGKDDIEAAVLAADEIKSADGLIGGRLRQSISTTYEARRPFHPQRLSNALNGGAFTCWRSKGVAWVAGWQGVSARWEQLGSENRLVEGGRWWAQTPPSEWPADSRQWREVFSTWREPFGDRRQSLTLAGVGLDAGYHRVLLDSCLLTPDELAGGDESGDSSVTPPRIAA
ncbi:MAG: GTP-binding protein [Planctomycetota bacterium]